MNEHYKKGLEPLWLITKDNLDFITGNIIKYIYKYPHKGQKYKDLAKIEDYCNLLMKYGSKSSVKRANLEHFLEQNRLSPKQEKMLTYLYSYLDTKNKEFIYSIMEETIGN